VSEKPVVFGGKEISPEEEGAYREKIRKAQGKTDSVKGSDPVGVLPRPSMPTREVDRDDGGGVKPRPKGSPVITPETTAMLEEAVAAGMKQEAAKEGEKSAEEKKAEDEDLFQMFDFGGRNEAERVLNNKKRRTEIEARCSPMSLDDLILKDEVQQLVPIVPGKFEVLYRSMTPDESLFIKRYVAKDSGQNDQYILERFSLCQLTCAVLAINGRPLPDHRNTEGNVDEKPFEAKLKAVMKKSAYVLADIGINYSWFDIRVRKLLNATDLGNG
jgi:hypothetical protein